MATPLIGTEYLGTFATGSHSPTLTIPVGTKCLLISISSQHQDNPDTSVDVGGVLLDELGWSKSGNQVGVGFKGSVDISARTDDDLSFSVPQQTVAVTAYYYPADMEFGTKVAAACSTCNGNFLSLGTIDVPAEAVTGGMSVVAVIAGRDTSGAAAPSGHTQEYSVAIGDDVGKGYHKYEETGETWGTQHTGLNFYTVISAMPVYSTLPEVVGHPIGVEMGFNAGTIAEVADKTLYAARYGMEMGFNEGRLEAFAGRQVALVGEDIETPEMTAGGTEGQVLTQHVGRRPTWEDGGASLTVKEADGIPTVLLVDTIVVNDGSLTDDGSGRITLDNTGPAGPAGPAGPTAGPGLSVYLYDNFK